ncbi:MAG TPA: hypothetical protein VEF05_04105 [Terriglobales bacterium]|nr:hypothetical protein [Terriglobales bacterium]
MKAGMLLLYEISGAVLFTTGAVLGSGFIAGLMLGVSFGFFALTLRERAAWPTWFQNFSLALLGTCFLLGDGWLVLHGMNSSPALITFGPGFLLFALYSFIKQRATKSST